MLVVVVGIAPGKVEPEYIVGPFRSPVAARRWIEEDAPQVVGWTWRPKLLMSPESLKGATPRPEVGRAAEEPETAAPGVVEAITPEVLAERIRAEADASLHGFQTDDPGATAVAIEALRLELRASTIEILDLGQDVVGALERVGLEE